MKHIWNLVYNFLFLPLFKAGILLLSLFNFKIKSSLKGRRDLFRNLKAKINELDLSKKNILIHCASLGEFEQAKPLIEELDKYQKYNFVVSFFSSSGYNHAKLDFSITSQIIKTYLPFDKKSNVINFLDIVNPSAVIFIKYDIWLNLIKEIYKRNIFSIVINSSYEDRKFSWRFYPSLMFKKLIYSYLNIIGVISEDDRRKFIKLTGSPEKVIILGNTKYERINKATERIKASELIPTEILKNKTVFVVGSSWNKDEEIIFPVLDKISTNGISEKHPLLTILVPHEPSEDNLESIEYDLRVKYPNLRSIRYSELSRYRNENIIIVDCVGILMGLYKYADMAYVGGGLNNGLHNVLEAAVYSLPVFFGNEKISEDAVRLVQNGGGISVSDTKMLYKNLTTLIRDPVRRKNTGGKSFSIFKDKTNVSNRIAEIINQRISGNV
ncbi:MAG: hypothetical protein N2510_06425 [Ignavibacteria bacterium]|nr:hypothetical protein [Ignavibacteria bacterium]